MHKYILSKPITTRMMYHVPDADTGLVRNVNLFDETGKYLAVPIDDFSGRPFMRNACGFITNDIMAFEESQSDDVARAVLARCQVLHPDNAPSDLTVDQLFEEIVPSNYGSPAEYLRLSESFARMEYARRNAALEEKSTEKTIEFAPSDVNSKSE